MLPFKEEKVEDGIFIRTFYSNVDSGDLKWHRDRESRIIEAIGDTDWKFQMDNELPIDFSNRIYIESGRYHRLIKGKGDLIIKMIKLNETH